MKRILLIFHLFSTLNILRPWTRDSASSAETFVFKKEKNCLSKKKYRIETSVYIKFYVSWIGRKIMKHIIF